MPESKFKLKGDPLNPLAKGLGGCFATNMVTVDGRPVGYMYREEPDNDSDSGWRFFAGDEPQDYIDDPSNSQIFDVNTIANHDPAIVAFLDAPYGAAFARNDHGKFEEVEFDPTEDEEPA